MSEKTDAELKEVILRFRVPFKIAQILEHEAQQMGLRVSEVARFRLTKCVLRQTNEMLTESDDCTKNKAVTIEPLGSHPNEQ